MVYALSAFNLQILSTWKKNFLLNYERIKIKKKKKKKCFDTPLDRDVCSPVSVMSASLAERIHKFYNDFEVPTLD